MQVTFISAERQTHYDKGNVDTARQTKEWEKGAFLKGNSAIIRHRHCSRKQQKVGLILESKELRPIPLDECDLSRAMGLFWGAWIDK